MNRSEGHPVDTLPRVYLVRHGETEWAVAGRHTGRTDVPLTGRGEDAARRLAARLAGIPFARVWTSPATRARRTAELAGFGSAAQADPDLWEWNYGEYEGLRAADIRSRRPNWVVFRDGAAGGESAAQVAARADQVIARARLVEGNVLIFSHGHFSRVLAARWVGLGPDVGRLLYLSTAAVCVLGYDHDKSEPVIRLWNDVGHLEG
jgi:broad specificity phosphatase PhoE